MIDLRPAADRLTTIVEGLVEGDLAAPTPCGAATVGDLVDHLGMFASNFARVARKELDDATSVPPPAFDARHLGPDWGAELNASLDALGAEWADERAWYGSTWVGGMQLPAEVAGVIALDELVVHGWDLATATGQPFEVSTREIEAATAFIAGFEAPRDGRLFGPVVEVAPNATPMDRLLGLAGRDPLWKPTR